MRLESMPFISRWRDRALCWMVLDGTGAVNEAGPDFYARRVDKISDGTDQTSGDERALGFATGARRPLGVWRSRYMAVDWAWPIRLDVSSTTRGQSSRNGDEKRGSKHRGFSSRNGGQ